MKLIFNEILSPASLIALIAISGFLLGKIKIKGISLGLAGILIVSVLYGISNSHSILETNNIPYTFLSSLGTAMFVPIIGIMSGRELLQKNPRKTFLSFCVGALSVLSASVIIILISCLDKSISLSSLLGLFTGALTSTPAFAASKELANISLAELAAGYGLSYFFGVTAVVLFVQMFSKSDAQAYNEEISKKKYLTDLSPGNTIFLAFLCSIIGQVLGKLPLPLLNTSIGASGGMLITGIVAGIICEKNKIAVSNDGITTVRTLGLTFFLIGCGVPAGIDFVSSINAQFVLYSIIIVVVAIATSYFSAEKLFKLSKTESLCTVCGSMTSTPAIAALAEKINEANKSVSYTAAYTGALLSLIVCVKLIYKALA